MDRSHFARIVSRFARSLADDRFAALTVTLGVRGTRRGALTTAFGGTLGVLGLTEVDAKKRRKKKRKKKKRKKERAACPTECCAAADCDDGNPCTDDVCDPNGTCSNPPLPELSECGGGKLCSGGVCAVSPTCQPVGALCFTNEACCSGVCIPFEPPPNGICQPGSELGGTCLTTSECISGTCIGFVCTA